MNKYRDNGLKVHGVLSFRTNVARPSHAQWERNWRYFVRQVMSRYRNHVRVWIIDNEPELGFGNYLPTPDECVAFTRIAWEELYSLGIQDRCQIESPPVRSVDSDYLRQMLDAGLSRYCHVIGVHCYGAQIEDHRIRRPWERLSTLGIRDRCVGISESGAIAAYAPSGFPGGVQAWRAQFHQQFWVQAKSFGYEYALLFDLDRWKQREPEWRLATFDAAGTTYAPIQPVWNAVRARWGTAHSFTNGGFEATENGLGNWMIRHNPALAIPPELRFVSFPRHAGKSRSGTGYCQMDLAGHTNNLVVRQVADGLIPGRNYQVTAHAYLRGGSATLKALGFNRFSGTAEQAATTNTAGAWQMLKVQVTPSNPWLVVELRSKGTNLAAQEVRWDDVSVASVA